jgi:DNA-binding transcriptional MerR regulator
VDGRELLTIGELARRSGLSAKALRHYDRRGLLRPTEVNPGSGYRWYSIEQLDDAVFIQRLRALDLPLDEVRRLLDLRCNQAAVRDVLRTHRRRVEASLVRSQRLLHRLDHLIADGMEETEMTVEDDTDRTKKQAAGLFNGTWTLLEKPDRRPADDARMIHMAHASAYHWGEVGGPENWARGEWQCSRVYSVVERPEPALFHARRCLALCNEYGIGDFDLAFAYEALARACAVGSDHDEARRWAELARSAAADIADDEDRDLVLADLETLPGPETT